MVDAFVEGVRSIPSRINPQSLNPIAFELLRELRQRFLERRQAGPLVGQRTAQALIEVQRTQSEKFLAVMVEIATVVLLAGRDAKLGLTPVFRYIFLGAIKAMQTLAYPNERIEKMLEQLVVAVFMTPVYEFQFVHYQRLAYLLKRMEGELAGLQKAGKCFSNGLLVGALTGLNEGFLNSLEIIDISAVEKEELKATHQQQYLRYLGYLDLLADWLVLWPPAWLTKALEQVREWRSKLAFKK